MGDHGMADGGGHGGSTIPEVLVPFLVISSSLTTQSEVSTPEVLVPFLVISGSLITQSEVSLPEVIVPFLVISGSLSTQSEVSITGSARPVPRHFRFSDNAE